MSCRMTPLDKNSTLILTGGIVTGIARAFYILDLTNGFSKFGDIMHVFTGEILLMICISITQVFRSTSV